jgi:protein-L-isoaspartate(D-aspartate) O-methyltransferase
MVIAISGCASGSGAARADLAPAPAPAPPTDGWADLRAHMVQSQIAARGVRDPRVLAALRKVPRHEFVPEAVRSQSYEDHPLPIGDGQTISQPYIVAIMTELAALSRTARVLEVGTGSGYQAAVLAEIAAEVWTIEIVPDLAATAADRLARLGYRNVHVRAGDGFGGWPEHSPFDAVVVTAAPPEVPPALKEQLTVGGRLVIPVGVGRQDLIVIERTAGGYATRVVEPVAFVPMTGEAQERAPRRGR